MKLQKYVINVAMVEGTELVTFSETHFSKNFADAKAEFYEGKGALIVHKEYE